MWVAKGSMTISRSLCLMRNLNLDGSVEMTCARGVG